MTASGGTAAGAGLAPAFAAARARLGLVAALFAIAIVGWVWTARQMRGMDAGPWTSLGGLGWFLGVWVVMMAAMMKSTLIVTLPAPAGVRLWPRGRTAPGSARGCRWRG